jgi:hypothetical protein
MCNRLYTIVQLWKENTYILFYSILFYSILLYYIFYSILFYSINFYCIHLVKCLVLKKGIEGALPLLVIQGLEELLDGGGYLGLCGDGGAGGGDCTQQAAPRAPPSPAARAAHAVAEVLQPQNTYKYRVPQHVPSSELGLLHPFSASECALLGTKMSALDTEAGGILGARLKSFSVTVNSSTL